MHKNVRGVRMGYIKFISLKGLKTFFFYIFFQSDLLRTINEVLVRISIFSSYYNLNDNRMSSSDINSKFMSVYFSEELKENSGAV